MMFLSEFYGFGPTIPNGSSLLFRRFPAKKRSAVGLTA